MHDIEKYLNNVLKPDDTFQFSCKMCGACCRKRDDPIVLSGLDLFRIAQEMECTIIEACFRYTRGSLGPQFHVPILTLRERDDGSCALLRKGKCMVHDNKPVVCAIYPLGRVILHEDDSIQYFRQDMDDSCGTNGKTWTLQEWLDNFHIHELDSMSVAWNRLLAEAANVMYKVEESDITHDVFITLLTALYLDYDVTKPYEEQAERNRKKMRTYLARKFTSKRR